MPRLLEYRERSVWNLFDEVAPDENMAFVNHVGQRAKTNSQMAGQLCADNVALIEGIYLGAPEAVFDSWAGTRWSLEIANKLRARELLDERTFTTLIGWKFHRFAPEKPIPIEARQAFRVLIHHGDRVPAGPLKVLLTGVLTRDVC